MQVQSKKSSVGEVGVVPAVPANANQVWKIYKAGRIAAQANDELDITGRDVSLHMLKETGGTVYQQKAAWEKRISHSGEDQQVLVALSEHLGVVGLVMPHITGGERWLSKLYVAKQAQGQGVAKRLIEATKAWHDHQSIKLRVAAYNQKAMGLYVSQGFAAVEYIECGYEIAGKPVPQVEMVFPGADAEGGPA